MMTRIQDKPRVSGTNRKWYNAVTANCSRDRLTTSSMGSMGDLGSGSKCGDGACRDRNRRWRQQMLLHLFGGHAHLFGLWFGEKSFRQHGQDGNLDQQDQCDFSAERQLRETWQARQAMETEQPGGLGHFHSLPEDSETASVAAFLPALFLSAAFSPPRRNLSLTSSNFLIFEPIFMSEDKVSGDSRCTSSNQELDNSISSYISRMRFWACLSSGLAGVSSSASRNIDKVGSISRRRRSSSNALKISQMSFGGSKYSRRSPG